MERNKALDGLRGLAIMAVMLSHSRFLFLGHPELEASVGSWFEGGALGVDLFFVLSGFLITSQLIESKETRGTISLREFYVNRVTRLLPALYLMLAVFLVVNILDGRPLSTLLPSVLASVFFFLNVKSQVSGNVIFDLIPLWSLSLEEQFYLAWPFVVPVLLRRSARTTATMIVSVFLLSGVWRAIVNSGDHSHPFAWTDFRFDGLLVGALLAYVLRSNRLSPVMSRWCGAVGAAVVAAHLALVSLDGSYAWLGGFTVFHVGAGLLVASLASSPSTMHGVLSRRAFTAVGRVSYGAYLWHLPIWVFVVRNSSNVGLSVRLLEAAVTTVGLTLLSWHLVEQPAMKLRPRLKQVVRISAGAAT